MNSQFLSWFADDVLRRDKIIFWFFSSTFLPTLVVILMDEACIVRVKKATCNSICWHGNVPLDITHVEGFDVQKHCKDDCIVRFLPSPLFLGPWVWHTQSMKLKHELEIGRPGPKSSVLGSTSIGATMADRRFVMILSLCLFLFLLMNLVPSNADVVTLTEDIFSDKVLLSPIFLCFCLWDSSLACQLRLNFKTISI